MSLYNMDTFIAPIGVGTDHVKVWLQEEARSSFTLWIIHSEKPSCNPDGTIKYDLPEIAKKLSEELEVVYPRMIIKFKTIDAAFALDPLMDAVDEIITETKDEIKKYNRDIKSFEYEIKVLQKLIEVLEGARKNARERYLNPIINELTPLLKLIWPESEINFNDRVKKPEIF